MKHSITFKNTDNKWDNALPLGNGCFGSMLYFEKNKLYMPMNHYEVYYNIGKTVLPEAKLKAYKPSETPGKPHIDAVNRADANQPVGNESFINYMANKSSAFDDSFTPAMGFSGSYPQTGNLIYNFHPCFKNNVQKAF